MASQVLMPSRAPTQLDALSTALQIGSTLYGIKYQGEKLEQEKQAAIAQKARDEQTSTLLGLQVQKEKDEAATRERLAKGDYTPTELSKLMKESGLGLSPTPTDIRVTVGGRQLYLSPETDLSKKKIQAEINKIAAETTKLQRETGQGKQISTAEIGRIAEGAAIPKMLDSIGVTLEQNQGSFGPVKGLLGKSPYATKERTIEGQLRTTAQLVGKYMEGGVLRKEDEAKYRDMLPKLTDLPEVAANKLQVVKKMLVDRYNLDVNALQQQGYNISGLPQFKETQLPAALTGQRSGGLIPSAQAAPQPKVPTFNPNKPFNVLGK